MNYLSLYLMLIKLYLLTHAYIFFSVHVPNRLLIAAAVW